MATARTFDDVRLASNDLAIRRIAATDLWLSLKEGYADFNAYPTFYALLFLVYPLFALLLILPRDTLIYLAFPAVAGLALVGPAVSVALFEISRRREQGLDVSWRTAFSFIHTGRFAPILALSMLMTALYVAWLFLAESLYLGLFGTNPPVSLVEFGERLVSTRPGVALILYGNVIGAIFAFTALAVSVVAFPLLLDKPVSTLTAIGVSIRAVVSNLYVMLLWGLIVAGLLAIGTALFLVGLAAVLPILGHSTWHLYRKLVT